MAEKRKREGEEGSEPTKRKKNDEFAVSKDPCFGPCGDLFYDTYKDSDRKHPRASKWYLSVMILALSYQWEDDHTLLFWNMLEDTSKQKVFALIFRNWKTLPLCSFKILSALLECLWHPCDREWDTEKVAGLLEPLVNHPFLLAHWEKALDVIPMHWLKQILLKVHPPNGAHQYQLARKVFTSNALSADDICDVLRQPRFQTQLEDERRFVTILSWISDEILLGPFSLLIRLNHCHIVGTEILKRLHKNGSGTTVEAYFSTTITSRNTERMRLVDWVENLYLQYISEDNCDTAYEIEDLAICLLEVVPTNLWSQVYDECSAIFDVYQQNASKRSNDDRCRFENLFKPHTPKGAME